jgi:transposase
MWGVSMRHVEGENRHQVTLLPESLEDFVAADHPVRVIDAYIDTLDLSALGFGKAVPKEMGRKPYAPADLLKLYVYGYLNRVNTSRRLERECQRNIELMWLVRRLHPDFKTIADFRKDNGAAIRGACRAFIEFCRQTQLLSGERVAIDGSKFKAAASLDQGLTRKQLLRDRARIEQQIQGYLEQLDRADREQPGVELERAGVQQALESLKQRAQRLQEVEQVMDASGRAEHCATEPDARLMRSGREGMVLGYNVQTAVEADTGLIVHHEVTDAQSDGNQLLPIAEQTKATLGVQQLEVLADAGYANGEHLGRCERQAITATVPRRKIPSSYVDLYQKSDFRYDPEQDCYRCPAGEILRRRGQDKRRKLHIYTRSGCGRCPLQPKCTRADRRNITRHFYEAAYARSEARLAAQPSLMKQRMGIVERPFAVLKQLMGFRRFNCWGLQAARTEMSIVVLAYNLKQMIHTMGVPRLLALLS